MHEWVTVYDASTRCCIIGHLLANLLLVRFRWLHHWLLRLSHLDQVFLLKLIGFILIDRVGGWVPTPICQSCFSIFLIACDRSSNLRGLFVYLCAGPFLILCCSSLACCFLISAFALNAQRLVLLLTLSGWIRFLKVWVWTLLLLFVQLLLLRLLSSNFVWAHWLSLLLVIGGLGRRKSWHRFIFWRLGWNWWRTILLVVLLLSWWLPLLLLLFQFWALIFETGQLLALRYSLT